MFDLILASQNTHKIKELKYFLASFCDPVQIKDLGHFPGHPVLLEEGQTFVENARSKAKIIGEFSGKWTLADDSGLEVEVLHGAPGVYSARYASQKDSCDDEANNQKLLKELEKIPLKNRQARYRCALVLFDPETRQFWEFEGQCSGVIATQPKGKGGFGYDPLFYMPDQQCTMAEISLETKNQISHRARAFEKLRKALPQILNSMK